MDKIILKAQNEEELNSMIKRSLTLGEDETYKAVSYTHLTLPTKRIV